MDARGPSSVRVDPAKSLLAVRAVITLRFIGLGKGVTLPLSRIAPPNGYRCQRCPGCRRRIRRPRRTLRAGRLPLCGTLQYVGRTEPPKIVHFARYGENTFAPVVVLKVAKDCGTPIRGCGLVFTNGDALCPRRWKVITQCILNMKFSRTRGI